MYSTTTLVVSAMAIMGKWIITLVTSWSVDWRIRCSAPPPIIFSSGKGSRCTSSLPPPSFLPISCAASVAHRPAPGALAHAGIQEKKRPKVREVEFLKSVYTRHCLHRQLFFYVCIHKFTNIECVSQAVFKRSFDLRVYYWLLGPLFDFTMSVEEKKQRPLQIPFLLLASLFVGSSPKIWKSIHHTIYLYNILESCDV